MCLVVIRSVCAPLEFSLGQVIKQVNSLRSITVSLYGATEEGRHGDLLNPEISHPVLV